MQVTLLTPLDSIIIDNLKYTKTATATATATATSTWRNKRFNELSTCILKLLISKLSFTKQERQNQQNLRDLRKGNPKTNATRKNFER